MNSLLLIFTVFVPLMHGTLAIYLMNATAGKIENNPAVWTETSEIWGPLLEEWAITNHREKRVMHYQNPMQDSYLIIERSDKLNNEDEGTQESKISPGNKIVTSGHANRQKPAQPGRQVSETDLYLLGAIEKLVYRVDFMEKRLRRVEEMLYFVMAGNRIDQEPCPRNFTRVGANCYYFSSNAGRELDWKAASKHCKNIGGVLTEMETIEENQDIVTFIQNTPELRGKDFWTGGLNPGLLWIWSNSARPVSPTNKDKNKKNPGDNIRGDGRCLRLGYDPALRSYAYRGTDCSVRYSHICEFPDTDSSNQIRRLGRSKKIFEDLN